MTRIQKMHFNISLKFLLIAVFTVSDNVICFEGRVDVEPTKSILVEGGTTSIKCRSTEKLAYCRIEIPGENILNLSPEWDNTPGFSYFGEGLQTGQCGVTIQNIGARNHGKFRCFLGTTVGKEFEGSSELIVALAPLQPEIEILTKAPGNAYEVDTEFRAKCISRDGRPAANLTWFIDNEPITQGLRMPEIVQSLDNQNTTLFTATQEIQRYLQASDDGKFLTCRSFHLADRGESGERKLQLFIRYRPQPLPEIKVYGLTLGKTAAITVTIHANPKPRVQWTVSGTSIQQGDQNERYASFEPIDLGNSDYNVTLSINDLTLADTTKNYYLKASNDLGATDYTIRISSSNVPAPAGLDIGTIIGIVVGIAIILIIVMLIIFARATGRWCFSGATLNTDIGPDSEAQINPHHNDEYDGKGDYDGDEQIDTTQQSGDETPPVTDKLEAQKKADIKNGHQNGTELKTNTPV